MKTAEPGMHREAGDPAHPAGEREMRRGRDRHQAGQLAVDLGDEHLGVLHPLPLDEPPGDHRGRLGVAPLREELHERGRVARMGAADRHALRIG
jgi:hypothetical protein